MTSRIGITWSSSSRTDRACSSLAAIPAAPEITISTTSAANVLVSSEPTLAARGRPAPEDMLRRQARERVSNDWMRDTSSRGLNGFVT
ncbi:hypothetical protein JCM9533A_82010 [Catenuloplanes niger JCM 9533]